MKKKIVLLIAALMCTVLVLAACINNDADKPEDIVLVKDDTCQFVIIGDETTNYLKGFLANIERSIKIKPTVYKTAAEAPEGSVKLFIGNPETFELDTLVPEVPYFGYLVKASDGDLYALAYDTAILGEAVGFLRMRFDEFYSEGNLVFAGDYLQTKAVSSAYGAGEAPYFEGGKNAKILDCDTDHQMVLLTDVEKAEFEAYAAKLKNEGYELRSENDMNGNLFKTYTKNGVMLHTYWTQHNKEVRTIVAKTDLLPITSIGGNNSLTAPSVHQLKSLVRTDQNVLDGGLGMVVELADGRFIIVDGGSNDADAREIYDYLKYAATDKDNIVIAAWFITHAHSDHYQGFVSFAKNYSTDSTIKIESFMYNQCYTSEQTKYIGETSDPELRAAMAKYYPSTPVYKPLTGQKYTFSTTTIEILYTMSDFLPNTIPNEADATAAEPKKGDGNVQSVIAMFDIVNNADKKDRLLITGDATKVACDEVTTRYKNYLKCDMVQVPHHGHGTDSTNPVQMARRQNGTKELYQFTNPSIAFWATSNYKYQERLKHSVNQYLQAVINKNKGTHYIAETSTNTTNTITFN